MKALSVDKEDAVFKEELPLGDRLNMVYSGSFVTYGRAKFIVTDIGMNTEVGKIAGLIKSAKEEKLRYRQILIISAKSFL